LEVCTPVKGGRYAAGEGEGGKEGKAREEGSGVLKETALRWKGKRGREVEGREGKEKGKRGRHV